MHIAIGIDLVHMPGLREQLELPGSSFRRGGFVIVNGVAVTAPLWLLRSVTAPLQRRHAK